MTIRFLLQKTVFLFCFIMAVPVLGEHSSSCNQPYDDLVVGIRELAREKLSLSQKFARPEELLSLEQSFLECFQEMIQNGLDVNHADADKQTPAIVAALYHLDPVVELLKNNGADLDAKDNSGYSANIIIKLKLKK